MLVNQPLGYTIAMMRWDNKLKNFAIFYSGKGGGMNDILFSVWIDGELKIKEELYGDKTMLKQSLSTCQI